jgi:hypothetical protein
VASEFTKEFVTPSVSTDFKDVLTKWGNVIMAGLTGGVNMINEEILKQEISNLVDKVGIDAASNYLNKIISDFVKNSTSSNKCYVCKNDLSLISKNSYLSCEFCRNCNREYIIYSGKIRTSKSRKTRENIDVVVRCYDHDGKERKIEFCNKKSEKLVEMKAGDEFIIYIHRFINLNFRDEEVEFKIYIKNITVNSFSIGFANSGIVDDLSAESIIFNESQLIKLPADMDPDVIVRDIVKKSLKNSVDVDYALGVILEAYKDVHLIFSDFIRIDYMKDDSYYGKNDLYKEYFYRECKEYMKYYGKW